MNEGLVKLTRSRVRCPGCGEEVLAVARDGVIRGWCSISRQHVNFIAVDNPTPETAEISASGPDPVGKSPAAETPEISALKRDYLAGVKVVVIQKRYGISSGEMYRRLHAAHIKLRTGKPNNKRSL